MIEFLTLAATLVIAVTTGYIAHRANSISHAAMKLEADKLLIDWSQRTASVVSRAVSLRLLNEHAITVADFASQRRELRAEVFAMIAEGRILLRSATEPAALSALETIAKSLDGRGFGAPEHGDYDTVRRRQVGALRGALDAFVTDIQGRISSDWLR